MRSLGLMLLLIGLAACGDSAPPHGAVRVLVKYLSHTPACIRVAAADAQGNRAETDIPRSAFKNLEARELNVAVFRKPEWAQELTLEVISYDGSAGERCSGQVLEQHRSPEPLAVLPKRLARFDVMLEARDDDEDGYVLKAGGVAGTDCDDSRRDRNPGAAELCTGTVDLDCDGLTACADSDCRDKACDDQNPCTENDTCAASSGSAPRCQGTPKRCEPPNLTCYTSESTCDPVTGACVHTQRPPDQACNDGNACTANDRCGVDAACAGTPSVQCNTPPSQCHESAGTCSAATGTCTYALKAAATACDDANACTTNDTCNGAGGCAGVDLPACTPSTVCHKSVRTGCPTSAACTESVDSAKVNTSCTVGAKSGVCRLPDGACSSFPYIPSNFDPDSIPATDTQMDLHIPCGSPTEPVVFDTSGTPSWTPPAGCTLPPMPAARIITQGGQETVLLPVRHFIVDASKFLRLRGSRPVIFAVYGNATIAGGVLANADNEVPGPGGNRAGCGSQKGGDGQFSSGEGSGGGGGGFGSAGGAGGANDSGQTSNGGTARSSTLVPLVGGCAGGRGGSSTAGGAGGGGGGALQVSVAGTLRVSGGFSVNGGGGRGGGGSASGGSDNEGGGGGGGSGGGLLLEAFRLELPDWVRITANGGSGAEGGDSSNRTGGDGTGGDLLGNAPATCPDTSSDGGRGGRGAAEGASAAAGAPGPNNAGAGGGGGGVGVIRLQGFGSCSIDPSCSVSDSAGCDLSPKVTPLCP